MRASLQGYLAAGALLNFALCGFVLWLRSGLVQSYTEMLGGADLPALTILAFKLPWVFAVIGSIAAFLAVLAMSRSFGESAGYHALAAVLLLDVALCATSMFAFVLPMFSITWRLGAG